MTTPPEPKLSEKHALIVKEMDRLRSQLGKLDREKQVGHKIALYLTPLALPALFLGWIASALLLVSLAAFYATVSYLTFVRRREYQFQYLDCRRDLERAGVRYQ